MANFYGGSSGGSVGGGGGSSLYTPFDTPDAPEREPDPQSDGQDPGKVSIDLGNLAGSIGAGIGSLAEFGSGLVGGVAGAVGQIGIPGGPNLGDLGELPGGAVDAVGQIGFGDGANVGAIPGLGMDLISAPGQFIQHETAEARVREDAGNGSILDKILTNLGGSFSLVPGAANAEVSRRMVLEAAIEQGYQPTADEAKFLGKFSLPPDVLARLESGEDIETLAGEMVEQGIGFSNDPLQNITSGVVLDPMNLIGAGAGKAITAARQADRSLRAGVALGVGPRFMGTAYGAASRGLSEAGAKIMDATLGPSTSGVFHALGTKPYFKIRDGLGSISDDYASAYEEAFALGAAQMPRAVIARYMADEATSAIQQYGKEAVGRLSDNVEGSIEARLQALRTIGRDQIERRAEELLNRTAPDFLGHTPEGLLRESAEKLAQITGASVEDATRILGGKVDVKTAQHIHLAYYGKAGNDLAKAKAATMGSKAIDAERLTLIAPDTLTEELASDLLSGKLDLVSAVDQFSILRNRFGGTNFDHEKVIDFVKKLASEDALPKAVTAPVTGAKKLPPAVKAWQRQYETQGYNVGFAPKDGWKTVIDENGEVLHADPFVHFVSEADPLTVRNPLGRFMDSLFRGSTQTTIISDARNRMVQLTRGTGISPNEARTAFQKVLQRAADEGTTPRGLSLFGGNVYKDIFKDVLGERYDDFVRQMDPDYAVMYAFQGNLSRVGLTQTFTGAIKKRTAGRGNTAAAITEGIYPTLRFRLSPLFQAQELTESPFLNALRGVQPRAVDPELAKVYEELADLPDFKYLTEAGYFLHIAGSQGVTRTMGKQSDLGRALSKLPNVKEFKERARTAQVFHEHGPAFEEAVNKINPKLWQRMVEAYGTNDSRAIADAFIAERQALASGNLDEALAVFDGAKPAAMVTTQADAPMDPLVFGVDGGYLRLPELAKYAVPDPRYAYHITPSRNLERARTAGLMPGKVRKGEVHGVYFGERDADLLGLLPKKNAAEPMMLRVDRSKVVLEGTDMYADNDLMRAAGEVGEFVSRDPVPPEALEVLGSDGIWRPLGRAQTTAPGAPAVGQGFDAWRGGLWDELKTSGKPIPKTDGLYRAMSDAEFEAARTTGEFKPLLGKDLYVTADPDRLAGGAYGGKGGGYIVEFDPSVPTHATKSRTVDLDEIAVESAPQSAVRRVWKWDADSGDHVLISDSNAIQRAYDAGDVATGQALNKAAGAARGGNGAGGAMKLTDAEIAKLGIKAETPSSHDMETVWQAFRESFRQSSEQAFKTHYFNPTRGFLERTINHPYLGLYPASYMWGKVLPEFARFLLKRPFGLNAPLVGLNAYNRVQQSVLATVATDPEFAQALEDNNDLIYLVEQMMPGTPGNLPANAPAWARHLAEDQLSGGVKDPQRFVEREVGDTFQYAAGPVRTFNVVSGAAGNLGDIAGDIFANLELSARAYDALVLPQQ